MPCGVLYAQFVEFGFVVGAKSHFDFDCSRRLYTASTQHGHLTQPEQGTCEHPRALCNEVF